MHVQCTLMYLAITLYDDYFQAKLKSMASALSRDERAEVAQSILRPRQNRFATRDARSMRRVIIKQGYLKKMPNSAKLGSSFRVIVTRLIIFNVLVVL